MKTSEEIIIHPMLDDKFYIEFKEALYLINDKESLVNYFEGNITSEDLLSLIFPNYIDKEDNVNSFGKIKTKI